MIQAINSKYCKNGLVQIMPYTAETHLILSPDEIILLKQGNKILINKYKSHPNRNLFPFSDKEQSDQRHFTEIFEYNKLYLNYRGCDGFSFHKNYFFKGNNRGLFLEESLPCDERDASKNTMELSRKEIEEIFNSNNYDIMIVMDKNGFISFVKSKKDKFKIGANIIPTNEEIVKKEVNSRIFDYNVAKLFNQSLDDEEKYQQASKPKTINEIKNFKIYGPALMGTYSHLLLTSKDGKFNLMWFRIDFIEKDRFRLTFSPIEIIEPTVDNVINYASNYDIDFAPEPCQSTKILKKLY